MTRVAAYCRVSTDKEDQANSLESQRSYFSAYIERHPGWELAGIYVDEGISGTSTKKRRAFRQMIADAAAGKFAMIITKEISRFARNTLDSILYTRQLKELGVGVIFVNDNINTLDADAELRLTIMSSIAQEESRKISERVKWGQQRRMEQGVVFGRDMLGYDVREGQLFVNENGAATVRLIFHKFVNEGKGSHVIARELREAAIPTATHMKQWSAGVILRVLRNEKYCGDLKQKKTITPSYLNQQKKYNRGEEDFVLLRNHHQPIISRELFEQAQAELARRAPAGEKPAKHSARHCFSGKIRCGLCGRSFVCRSKKRKDGSVYRSWRCYMAVSQGRENGCANCSLNEEVLRRSLPQLLQNLPINTNGITDALCCLLERQKTPPARIAARLEALEQKKRSLVELYLNGELEREDLRYFKARCQAEIEGLREQALTPAAHAGWREEALALLAGQIWSDAFYRQLVEKIIVHGPNRVEVYICGLKESFWLPGRY